MNHYLTLGIAWDADQEAIRRAFRTLVQQYHPDAGLGSSAERFRQIVEAYDVLRDPDRRAIYDAALRSAQRPRIWPRMEPMRAGPPNVEPLVAPRGPRYPRQPSFERDWVDEVFDEIFRFLHEIR
jgi:curved DNA-binding protein CbpA